jgi:cardiolipin synthase A/B
MDTGTTRRLNRWAEGARHHPGHGLATSLIVVLVLNLALGDKRVDRRIKRLYPVSDPQFIRTMGVMLGPSIVSGNRMDTLVNGEEIFPAHALRDSRGGAVQEKSVRHLPRRSPSGSGRQAHVILDWVGSGKIDQSYLDEMEKSGVNIERYHQVR